MSINRNNKPIDASSWAKLDLAEMPHWPDMPRRLLLALFAVMLALVLGWLFVKPLFDKWQIAETQTVNFQEQYIQIARHNAQQINMQANAQTIANSAVTVAGLPSWLSMIAQTAQQQNLHEVIVSPVYLKGSESKPNSASGNVSNQDSNTSKNELLNDPHVGQLIISATGKYNDLLKWATLISSRDEVLGVDEITMQAVKSGGVHWQARILFAQEARP